MIELRNIKKVYKHNNQSHTILDDLSYTFKEGTKTSILGESGSGKTTLLNIIGGIDLDFDGDLYFKGKQVTDFDKFRREHVSFIFQSLNLISHLSLIKNITISLTNDVKHKEERAVDLLKQVGLYEHRDKKPHQLSGGERQRVAIARALARESDILLCDEPTGSLDEDTKQDIMNLIMDVFKDRTVIFVTHDEKLSHQYADTILKFDKSGISCEVIHEKKIMPKDRLEKGRSFNKRFEFNLLSRRIDLFNASYLIIIISAIFLFGTGIIRGIETEVDNFYIDKYKVDKIDVYTTRYTVDGFKTFVNDYNMENESQIIGYMAKLNMDVRLASSDQATSMALHNIQGAYGQSIHHDLIAGSLPESNQEILYSKGAALKILMADNRDLSDLSKMSDDDLLSDLQALDISYLNTYQYNEERYYDALLKIVGLIDDYNYFDNEVTDEDSLLLNSNIYVLDQEFMSFIDVVYLGERGVKFQEFSIFIEEENFDLRNDVFDAFLLRGYQISGRDTITKERNDYHERLHGYKITLMVGCFILLIFGAISIYNGIQTSIVRNKKNIGIYKSLGYTSKNIKAMFVTEGVIISIFTITLSLLIWLTLKLIMNDYIVNVLDPTNKFGFENLTYLAPYALVIVTSIVVTIIMTSIHQEFKKINIVSLIKHK
ncbi:ABC transporter ATP-binding protein/permease [Acidaminobacter sp. JC074]|uniref:ABC transporter ATP-binding protein/permease n=1 Tax=Acidaminobacter sp. JC074 TaxID=2530199 RepID=UPI001F106D59|nr:ABC transporter ATP-binding protein/permease [Acidaminobacter sp. JC074]MCH4891124.1 ABC transporter ATP-binding protein/permease [Acidaminobacter sp. JC074]